MGIRTKDCGLGIKWSLKKKKLARRRGREQDQIEYLEERIRELKQENRSLLQKLKKVSRGYRKYLAEDVEEKESPKEEEKKICYECGKGEMVLFLVINRRWRQCNLCDNRTKTKIVS